MVRASSRLSVVIIQSGRKLRCTYVPFTARGSNPERRTDSS